MRTQERERKRKEVRQEPIYRKGGEKMKKQEREKEREKGGE